MGTKSPSDTAPAAPDTNRKAQLQEQAAKARAAKAAKQAAVQAGPQAGPADVAGPVNGADDADDDDPLGLGVAPGMSPAEARDEALALVRQVYYAGHTAQVKTLQQAFNVATFKDVPVSEGHNLYRQALKMAQDTGVRP